jgi:hypothetical protein
MRRPFVIVGLLAALALSAPGCQKLDAPPPASAPRTVTLDAVPSDMGELFAVTTAPEWPRSAQLWFLKPDRTITMVAVDMKTLRMSGTTVVIPRR